ncbi:MAG TPA: L28 family ribosomal protein [bacterium]|nr:L28 family ribosomal protein [bacterium]HOA18266.1 L28 family ribosomal protein [bacterium]
MSRICQICGKGSVKAHLVSRGVGNRVTRRTIIRRMPNLRSKKFKINGVNVRFLLCSSCLKRMKRDAKEESSN